MQVPTTRIATVPARADSNQRPTNASAIAAVTVRPPPQASAERATRTRRDAPSGWGLMTATASVNAKT
jgi:hypothetical protein